MNFAKAVYRSFTLLLVLLTLVASNAQAAGLLRVGVQLEPPNLDPTSGSAAAIDEIVYANVFEGLTRIREDGSVAPALAREWTISPDGRVYEFRLQSRVFFHDGAAFGSEDVVFSFERARSSTSTNAQRPLFDLIESVEAVSQTVVRVILKEPVGEFLTYLGWGDFVVVSPNSAATNATNPIGTGPYRFASWRKGAAILLTRNEDYWGRAAALDGIEFVFVPDPTAAFAALMAGDIDGFPNYPAAENIDLLRRDERFKVLEGTSEGETILAINNAKPLLSDRRVRRALAHAIDKRTLIDTALFGYGTPIGSHFPPHHPSYEDLADTYQFDPEKARALLREALGSERLEIVLTLPPPAYARRSGEVIAAQLEAVGVTVEIRNLEWAQWLEQVFSNGEFDLTIVSHTEPLDIDIYARENYYFHYASDDFNRIIDQLRTEQDATARDALYRTAQRILSEDAVNVFLVQSPKIGVWRSEITGIWSNSPLQANDLTMADAVDRGAWRAAAQHSSALPIGTAALLLIALAFAGLMIFAQVDPAYVVTRFATAAATLLIGTLIIFFAVEIAPGDPALFMMGLNADPQAIAAVKAELGLDKGVIVRYFSWLAAIFFGDFGVSYTYRTPVVDLIAERMWVTFPLALMSFFIASIVGIAAGVAAATQRDKLSGRVLSLAAQTGVAVPNFWFAILLVMIFSVGLGWLPAGGFPGWRSGLIPALQALLLPAIALAAPQAAILAQVTRSSMIETLRADFIRTARAKGASRSQVVRRHAFRNALIPVLTIMGLQFAFLIAGSVIIENVFYLPGLGRLVFQAITQRDLIVVESVVLILLLTVIAVSLAVDLIYAIVDPRTRRSAT